MNDAMSFFMDEPMVSSMDGSMDTRLGRCRDIVHGRTQGEYMDDSMNILHGIVHGRPRGVIVPWVPHRACHGEMTRPMSFFMDNTIEPPVRRLGSWLVQCSCMAAHHGACYGLCHGVCCRVVPRCPNMFK